MAKKSICKFERILYIILGVEVFRRLVFLLEKIVHLKDKGQNQNYHIDGYNTISTNKFIKFLFFNGAIHAKNLIIIIIYFLIKAILNSLDLFSFEIYDFIILAFGIKDLYCIMLQRYNYIRIILFNIKYNKQKDAQLERKSKRIKENLSDVYDKQFINKDLELINRLQNAIQNNEFIEIKEADIDSIDRLSKILSIK